jgi:hypothetical protein
MTGLYGGLVRPGVRLYGGLGGLSRVGSSGGNWLGRRAMLRLHLCSA